MIQEETRRLSRLVDNLLDLSRLEAGAAEPRREWTSIEELIRAALAELGARAGGVQRSRSTATCRWCGVDPVQMERAFVNVLENARRHSGGHPCRCGPARCAAWRVPPARRRPARTAAIAQRRSSRAATA